MRVEYCPTELQKGDLFTKALQPAAFETAKGSIGIRPTTIDEVGCIPTVWDGGLAELSATADEPRPHGRRRGKKKRNMQALR